MNDNTHLPVNLPFQGRGCHFINLYKFTAISDKQIYMDGNDKKDDLRWMHVH